MPCHGVSHPRVTFRGGRSHSRGTYQRLEAGRQRKKVPIVVPLSIFLTAPSPSSSGVPFLPRPSVTVSLSLPLALLLRPLTLLLPLMLLKSTPKKTRNKLPEKCRKQIWKIHILLTRRHMIPSDTSLVSKEHVLALEPCVYIIYISSLTYFPACQNTSEDMRWFQGGPVLMRFVRVYVST